MEPYPVRLHIEYQEEPQSRFAALFRIILVLPVLIIWVLLSWPLGLAVCLLIVFRGKYPRWWFDFTVEYMRFGTRVNAYAFFLTDAYPSVDQEQSVRLEVDYPEEDDLARLMPLVKWLFSLPHYLILMGFSVVMYVLLPISWIMVVILAQLPRAIHEFVVGYLQWDVRVRAYGIYLMTDRYPPFRLND